MSARVRGGVIALLVTLAPAARADPGSASAAEALFREAVIAQQHGRYAEACDKLAESNRLERAVGTEYNLGVCYELTRRVASARRAYLGAASLAAAKGNAVVAKDARMHATKLEATVPRLVLRRAPSAATATVTCDDAPVDPEAGELEVDPGPHRIHASATGRASFDLVTDIALGQRTEVVVALDPLPPVAAGSGPVPGPAPPEPPPERRAELTTAPLAFVGLAMAGAGVIALGAGAVFAYRGASGKDDSGCRDGRYCPDEAAASRLRDAKASADVATFATAAGAILTAGGLALYLFTPRRAVRAGLTWTPAGAGVALAGELPMLP